MNVLEEYAVKHINPKEHEAFYEEIKSIMVKYGKSVYSWERTQFKKQSSSSKIKKRPYVSNSK